MKEDKFLRTEKEKDNLLREELAAIKKHERLRTLGLILSQPVTYYKLTQKFPSNDFDSTRKYILNSNWL